MTNRYHMPGAWRRVQQFGMNLGWIWRNLRDGKRPSVWFPFGRGVSREAMDWAGDGTTLIDLRADTAAFEDYDAFRRRVRKQAAGEE